MQVATKMIAIVELSPHFSYFFIILHFHHIWWCSWLFLVVCWGVTLGCVHWNMCCQRTLFLSDSFLLPFSMFLVHNYRTEEPLAQWNISAISLTKVLYFVDVLCCYMLWDIWNYFLVRTYLCLKIMHIQFYGHLLQKVSSFFLCRLIQF